MKEETIFLRSLAKELRFLKDQDKDTLILDYQTKIEEEYQKGYDMKKIISSFEAPKDIAKKVYDEAGFNTKTIEDASMNNYLFMKSVFAFLSVVPQFILFISSMILFIAGLTVALATIPVVILFWLNFDPVQAAGPAFLALGLMPIMGMSLLLIGREIFKLESLIFRSIWKSLTARIIKPNQIEIASTKNKKRFLIILTIFLSFLSISGIGGTFATDQTIGRTMLRGEFLHIQTDSLCTLGMVSTDGEPIEINYQELESVTWFGITFIGEKPTEENKMEDKIEIYRGHNDKESLKIKYAVKRTTEHTYKLDIELPWNVMIFNLGGNMFVVHYDITKYKFVT